MQEIKKPRKPLIYYYVIVLAVLLLFNFLIMPWAAERRIREGGYETSERLRSTRVTMRSFLPIKTETRSTRLVWWRMRI